MLTVVVVYCMAACSTCIDSMIKAFQCFFLINPSGAIEDIHVKWRVGELQVQLSNPYTRWVEALQHTQVAREAAAMY